MVDEPEAFIPDWNAFAAASAGFGAPLSEKQVQAFAEYLRLLREWNEKFNLTAITQPQAIVTKHFLDSLTVAGAVDLNAAKRMIDIGTGAGFPGLALKIAFPHLQVTLLDALQKRIRFLERVAEALDLKGLTFVHGRAEDAVLPKRFQVCGLKESLRERFDVVAARAVAPLDVLTEWLLPYARVGGWVVAMKGPDVVPEVTAANVGATLLGGGHINVRQLTLPAIDEEGPIGRSLVTIKKEQKTPASYPRLPGSARKQPLGTECPRRERHTSGFG
jgi:16S rRNA (guanine527-N7)-methyltransferase